MLKLSVPDEVALHTQPRALQVPLYNHNDIYMLTPKRRIEYKKERYGQINLLPTTGLPIDVAVDPLLIDEHPAGEFSQTRVRARYEENIPGRL